MIMYYSKNLKIRRMGVESARAKEKRFKGYLDQIKSCYNSLSKADQEIILRGLEELITKTKTKEERMIKSNIDRLDKEGYIIPLRAFN